MSDKNAAWVKVHTAYKGRPIVTSEKKAAWDAVHSAYSVVNPSQKLKAPSPPPIGTMSYKGMPQKEEIPEREGEGVKEVKAKEEPAKKPKKEVKKIVSPYAIEQWIENMVKIDLVEEGTIGDLGKEADDYIQKLQDEGEYNEIQEESLVSRGHGEVAEMIYKHFLKQGNSPKKIKDSMRELIQDGYSMFEDIVG